MNYSARAAGSRRILLIVSALFSSFIANAQTFKVTEPFTGTTAPGWTLSGNASLTAPGIDADGSGWLRLTSAGGNQSGLARYTGGSFASNQSIVVKIGFVAWGGSGADGISVFLYDSTANMSGASAGGGLGYCGGAGGYLAIGLDEYGNFSNPGGGCGPTGPGFRPDYLVIRGPQSSSNPFVTNAAISGGIDNPFVGARPAEKAVLLIMEPDTVGYRITARFQSSANASYQTLFQDVSFPYVAPANLSIGFSGSTGGATNYHELHGLAVSTPSDLTVSTSGPASAERGDAVTYTMVVTNNGSQAIDALNAPTITSSLPVGITNVTWTCATGTGGATCASTSGNGNINSATTSLPAGGSVIYTIQGTVSPSLSCGTALNVTGAADFGTSSSDFTDVNPNDNTSTRVTTTSCTASVNPTSLTFAARALNTTSTAQSVVLSGTGGAAIGTISVSGDFAQTNNCSSALDDTSCTINVTFTPTVGGARTGTLSITTSASGTPISVPLSGTGWSASAAPGSLSFGSIAVGGSSASQNVTISGNGGTTVSSVSVSGDYSQTNNCSTPLSGTSCTIQVTFSPTATGTRTGTLSITTTASGTPMTVSLSGTGTMSASLDQGSLTFGSLAVSSISSAQSLTLSGTGGASVTNVQITGDYAQTNNCSAPLTGTSCTIQVTFSPTATGARNGTLSVTTTASGTPLTVSLSGTGTMSASLSSNSLDYGSQTVGSNGVQTITVSGTGAATVTAVSIDGDYAQTNNCSSPLAGTTCTIDVTFTPSTAGTRTGTLSVITSASGTPMTVNLTGVGTRSAAVNLTSMNFGSVKIGNNGTLTVTLSGTGGATVSTVSVTGDFTQTNNCTSALSGATCTITVTFAPTAQSTRTGVLTIATNVGAPIEVTLTGSGYPTAVVKSGGGSMDMLLLIAVLMLLSLRYFNRYRVGSVIVAATMSCTSASAMEPFSLDNAYIGGKFGIADSSLTKQSFTNGLNNKGYEVSGTVTNTRTSGGIYVGYEFSNSWSAEFGWSYLGEVRAILSSPTDDLDGLLKEAADLTRGAGNALWLTGRYRYSFGNRLAVDFRAGPYHWQTDTEIDVEGEHRASRSDSGFGYTVGVSPRFSLTERIATGLSVDYFSATSKNRIWQFTTFFDYRF